LEKAFDLFFIKGAGVFAVSWRGKMQIETIYEEKIFSKEMMAIALLITAIFLVLLIYQIVKAPIGNRPAPNWLYLSLFLLFLGITFIFNTLSIKITSKSINVSFGILRYSTTWENVENCFLDKTSAIWYGGWGIRLAKAENKWRLIYNVIGVPRVVISLRKGGCREFAFSTKNPEEVIKIIERQIRPL